MADNQRVLVALTGVNGTLNVQVALGFLIGDVNGSRSLNAGDLVGAKARAGQAADAGNFLFDINTSGVITAAAISAVKARPQLVLP